MAASTRGWTDRATSALLEALKTRKNLWNTKSESYKNRNTEKKHYDEMVERPSSLTFLSFFHDVNNKKCSYSSNHSCLSSSYGRHPFRSTCYRMSPLFRVISGAYGN